MPQSIVSNEFPYLLDIRQLMNMTFEGLFDAFEEMHHEYVLLLKQTNVPLETLQTMVIKTAQTLSEAKKKANTHTQAHKN
jgi:hypothetical protein